MKKKITLFLSAVSFITLLSTGCGDAPLGNALDFIPNRAPAISNFTCSLPEGNTYLTPGMVIDISLTAADPEGGIIKIEFTSDRGSFSNQYTADDTTTVDFIVNDLILGGEKVYVSATLTDPEGVQTIQRLEIGSGKLGPTISEAGTPNRFTRPYTADVTDERTFVFTSDSDGIYQVHLNTSPDDIPFDRDEAVFLYYTDDADTIEITVNDTDSRLDTEGIYYVHVIFKDFLDQQEQFCKEIIVDGTNPDTGSITCPVAFTNNTAVNLSMTATYDPATESPITEMWLSNDITDFDDINNAVWEPFTSNRRDWSLNAAGDGEKKIYALFKDQAGNATTVASPVNGSIILDRSEPTGSITIVDDKTKLQYIYITPDASDTLSGITSVALSDSSTGPWNWQTMPAAGSNLSYYLPELTEGTKTVYAAYRDGAGNVSTSVISDTIEVDLTPPADIMSLTATPYNGRIELSWTNPADDDRVSIVICRQTGSIPIHPTKDNIIETLSSKIESYSDKNIVNGTNYGYLVVTRDSLLNTSDGVTTPLTAPYNHAPDTPTGLTLENQIATECKLSWSPVTDPDGDAVTYIVRVSINGGKSYTDVMNVGTTDTATVLKSSVPSAELYYFAIAAIDDDGLTSSNSNPVMVTFPASQSYSYQGKYPETPGSVDYQKISCYNNTVFVIDTEASNHYQSIDISDITAPTPKNMPSTTGFHNNFATATSGTYTYLAGSGQMNSNTVNQYSYTTTTISLDNTIYFGSNESRAGALEMIEENLLIGADDALYACNTGTQAVNTINLGGTAGRRYDIVDITYDVNIYAACRGELYNLAYYNNGLFIVIPDKKIGAGLSTYSVQRFIKTGVNDFLVTGVDTKDGIAYISAVSEKNGSNTGLYTIAPNPSGIFEETGFLALYPGPDGDGLMDVAIIGNFAFVAKGTAGMDIINISSPQNPELEKTIEDHQAWAFAISGSNLLVAAGTDGIYTYTITE